MGNMIGMPELIRRSGASRDQIDWLRKKYPALLAPTRFGNYLCWRPEIAQVVAALISARKVEAHASY
jgi:hypothetical protein